MTAMYGRIALRKVLPRRLALGLRREWLVRQVVAGRAYVETDIAVLPQFVGPTDICWDIGANSGTYTVALSRLAARVCAFEPVPHNLQILERVVRRARLRNVTISASAVGDVTGAARMTVPTEGFYGGYYMAALAPAGELSVPMTTIDQLIADGWPEPTFIKCDVEGAETRVVSGARSLIERRRPIWLIETFEDDLIPLMQSYGYRTLMGGARMEPVSARSSLERNYWFLPSSMTGPVKSNR